MKSKPVTYRFQIRGIGLDKEVLAKIYAGNFQRLAGAKPRPINFDKALEYCGYLKTFAEASENRDKLVPKIQKIIAQLQQFRALAARALFRSSRKATLAKRAEPVARPGSRSRERLD